MAPHPRGEISGRAHAPHVAPWSAGTASESPEVRARIDAALALVPVIVERLPRLPFARGARKDDLRSYANEGALSAGRSYDPSHGVPFDRWATLNIRRALVEGLRAESMLSRRLKERLRAIDAAIDARAPEKAESIPGTALAADARVTDRLAAMATAYAAGILMTRDQATLESIEDTRGTPEDELARHELKAAVRSAIAERPEAERVLLERYYFDDATMAEASGGRSRPWASRLHARAIGGVAKSLMRANVVVE